MRRKMNRQELEQAYERAREQESILYVALNLAMSGKPDHVEKLREKDWNNHDSLGTYTYRLYGANRTDGGYVILTYSFPGQSDSTCAYLLDRMEGFELVGKIGIERCKAARARLWAEKDAAASA